MSISAFARKCGLDKSYISRLESGRSANLSSEKGKRIADELGLNVEWLLHGTGKKQRQATAYPANSAAPMILRDSVPEFIQQNVDRYNPRPDEPFIVQATKYACAIQQMAERLHTTTDPSMSEKWLTAIDQYVQRWLSLCSKSKQQHTPEEQS